jgi:sortase A
VTDETPTSSNDPGPASLPEELTEKRPDRVGQVAGIAGKVLIGAGVIVLLFTLFQIFGTSYIQHQHQKSLRSEFEKRLHSVTSTTQVNNGPPVPAGQEPTPSVASAIAILEIPKINVNQIVVQGTNDAQLQLGPAHYTQTPLPGQEGNVGIAGHRTTWGRPFYNLNELKNGDKIILSTTYGTYTYSVTSSQIVAPTDVAVLNPTTNATLTLTTCNPRFSAAQRLVVQAVLTSSATATTGSGTLPTLPPPTNAPVQVSSSQGPAASILLGILTALLGAATLFLATKVRPRWAVYVVGGVITFVALMFFFAAISQILPASI